MRGGDYVFELPHKIHTLSFGPNSNFAEYERNYNLSGFTTLHDHVGKEERSDGYKGPYQHNYYITVVPNVFDGMFGLLNEVFQYTASYYHRRDLSLNNIIFR